MLITCADNEANLANQHIKLKLMMRSRHKNDVYTKLKLSLLLIVEINDDISKFHIVIKIIILIKYMCIPIPH